MRKSPRLVLAGAVVALGYACGETPTGPTPEAFGPAFTHVDPVLVASNPACQHVGYQFGLKIENPVNGTYTFEHDPPDIELTGVNPPAFPGESVTISASNDTTFSWSSTVPILAVIVKGGPDANVYEYDVLGETSDTGLHAPVNDPGPPPRFYGLGHVELCYDPDAIILANLSVEKTTVTHKDRAWTWDIEKAGDATDLKLASGESFLVNYTVTVSATSEDTNTLIEGVITITNTNTEAGQDITINSVDDLVAAGAPADVACGVDFTNGYVLAATQELICTYEATEWGANTSGTNVVTVNATRGAFTADFEAEADWDFAAAVIGEETDECIGVSDDQGTPGETGDDLSLGEVCADDLDENGEYTFDAYQIDVGALNEECVVSDVTNVASFITNDTDSAGDDDHTVTITEDCENGCTLTPGYWKTHSTYGPAPTDQSGAWESVGGPDATFFHSGKTWYELLWTPPAGGNAYIQLAHAYMAAKLSIAAGADPSEVAALITSVETFFSDAENTPAITYTREARTEIRSWAATLDNYVNGLTGPGHCNEG